MKIYIAGRITGNPNYKAQFKATAAMLQEEGHTVPKSGGAAGGHEAGRLYAYMLCYAG